MNKYTNMKKWLKYSMTLYTVALMCVFFVIVGANDALTKAKTVHGVQVLATIDYLNLFGIMTAAFFGLAMFENHGKLTGFWGLVSAVITTIVFWQAKIWTLFALYLYNDVTNVYLTFTGGNEEKQIDAKNTIIQLILVFIFGIALQYFFDWKPNGFSVKLVDVLSYSAFILTGIGQTLLIKQTRWQFAAWVPKNGIELVVGIMTAQPVVICRNIFFLFMNVFSLSNWILTEKEDLEDKKLAAQK